MSDLEVIRKKMEKAKVGKRAGSKKEHSPKLRKKRRRIILLSVVGLLVVIRILLPSIILRYVNNKLANLTEYYGHVDDIDLHLYRGAYAINDIQILKRDKKTKDSIPFFSSKKIDLAVEWGALFKGSLVGEIDLQKPVLNFVKGAHAGEDVKADTADFRKLIDAIIPLTVNKFEINRGEVHYIDLHSSPKIDIYMKNINAKGSNISNVEKSRELLPAKLVGTGDAYEGKFTLNMKFNAMAIQPTFDLTTEMRGMNLVLLNDFLRAYGNFDVKKGNLGLFAEFAAKEGKFGGYIKPILKDLDVVQWNKEEGDVPQILWESLIGFGAEVLQNQSEGQLATKIPISGTFQNPDVDIWRAGAYLLKNAFIQALKPSVDNSIDIHKLKEKKSIFKKQPDSKKKTESKKDTKKKKKRTSRRARSD